MREQAEPYAATRLDALRKLRREGYAVVNRESYERWRKLTVDDPTSIYHEAEQQSRRLVEAERIITMAAMSGSYESDMLERLWRDAREWLDDVPAQSVPADISAVRDRQPWEFFDGD